MKIAYFVGALIVLIIFGIFVTNTGAYFKKSRVIQNTPTPTKQPTPTSKPSLTPTPTKTLESVKITGLALATRVNPICVASHIEEEHLSVSDLDRQLTLMQQAGVAWVRFDFVWDNLMSDPGVYDWAYYDNLVNKVNAKGMKVLALVADWGIPSWEDESINPDRFGDFTRALAAHYKGKILLYQIGNEPNEEGVSAARYAKILIASYNGIKAADSSSKVISAGLPIDDRAKLPYIQEMYNNGIKDHFDYFGMHPYSWPFSPDENNNGWGFSILKDVKAIMDKNGDSSKKIIASEFGWPSTKDSGGVDEATQANYINKVYQTIETNNNFKYVTIACVYDFMDDGTDRSESEHNFGIIRRDFSQKPAFNTMVQLRKDFNTRYSSINP